MEMEGTPGSTGSGRGELNNDGREGCLGPIRLFEISYSAAISTARTSVQSRSTSRSTVGAHGVQKTGHAAPFSRGRQPAGERQVYAAPMYESTSSGWCQSGVCL